MSLGQKYTFGSGLTGAQSIASAERVLFHVIKTGLEALRDTDGYVERVLRLCSPGEQRKIKKMLKTQPIQVAHGYARRSMKLPLIAITILDEREDISYIGDWLGSEPDQFDESTPAYSDQRLVSGNAVESRLQVHILDKNPDTVAHLYSICWTLIRGSRQIFIDLGMELTTLTGSDLMPNPELGPELVYARQCTLGVRGVRTYTLPAKLIGSIKTTIEQVEFIADV